MTDRHFGFGPPPSFLLPLWGGVIFTALGTLSAFQDALSGGAFAVFGIALMIASHRAQRAWRREQAALQQLPPTPRRILTDLALDALSVTRADLAANAQGVITSAQRAIIGRSIGAIRPAPIQSVAGAVTFVYRRKSRLMSDAGYDIAIDGTRFLLWHTAFRPAPLVAALKRTATYRVYFIDAAPLRLWRLPVRYILSVEAVADA